jgi:hypothetical protein
MEEEDPHNPPGSWPYPGPSVHLVELETLVPGKRKKQQI